MLGLILLFIEREKPLRADCIDWLKLVGQRLQLLWDSPATPIFCGLKQAMTFAEIPPEVKRAVSRRGRAFVALLP